MRALLLASTVGALVATAITLHRTSRGEIEREMEDLADVAADALVRQFGEDLDDARER